jgi:hypothetical protein
VDRKGSIMFSHRIDISYVVILDSAECYFRPKSGHVLYTHLKVQYALRGTHRHNEI